MNAKEGNERFYDEKTGNEYSVRGLIHDWAASRHRIEVTLSRMSRKDRQTFERTVSWMRSRPLADTLITCSLPLLASTEELIKRAVSQGVCPPSLLVDQARSFSPSPVTVKARSPARPQTDQSRGAARSARAGGSGAGAQ
jgi:hypothetical protein